MRLVQRRDVALGLVVIAVIIGVVVWLRQPKTPEEPLPTPTPSTQERLKEQFKIEIPEDVEKADLGDVTGKGGVGFATRKFEGGIFTHTVLMDVSPPPAGQFYEGWLVRGRQGGADFAYISTGKFRVAKGGYLLEFQSSKDWSDYRNVVVTLEKVDDKKPEAHILEGSF